MSRAESEAQKMTDNQGIIWKPLYIDGVNNDYLISEKRDVYNFRRHALMSSDCRDPRYKGQYVRLCCGSKKRSFRLDVLMRIAFPELFANDTECWKLIRIGDEPTCYEVTPSGSVRRQDNHRAVKPLERADGYCLIRLRHHGRTVTLYLHRIVANAFLPNPDGLEIINHKDENKANNAVSNLEWCDKSYNIRYAGAAARAGSHANLTKKLKALADAGNKKAAEILQTKRYYDNDTLLQDALRLTA